MDKNEHFFELKSLLFSLAYKMTGRVEESQDIVQDVFEKYLQTNTEINYLKSYLSKAVTNACINFLKEKQKEREKYFGKWLPEPLDTNEEIQFSIDDHLHYGFMLLLENLSPLERAIYLLRESFEMSFRNIAENFELKEDNCRQLYHRSRKRLTAGKRFNMDPKQKETILSIFEKACLTGNITLLIDHLKDDIIIFSDGGGKVPAAVNEVTGKVNAEKFLQGIYRKNEGKISFTFTYLNGSPAAIVYIDNKPDTVAVIETDEDGIGQMYFIRNPEKISHLTEKYDHN